MNSPATRFRMADASTGGDDTLRGGAGSDTLFGDARGLSEFAAGGDDRLFGGGGDDELWGDGELLRTTPRAAADRFFFAGGFGDDTIQDFRQGEDTIVFQGFEPSDFQSPSRAAPTRC